MPLPSPSGGADLAERIDAETAAFSNSVAWAAIQAMVSLAGIKGSKASSLRDRVWALRRQRLVEAKRANQGIMDGRKSALQKQAKVSRELGNTQKTRHSFLSAGGPF